MTKKHYEAIASILSIRHSERANARLALRSIEERLADYFESDNKLFNREKFLNACGVETCICVHCGSDESYHANDYCDNCDRPLFKQQ